MMKDKKLARPKMHTSTTDWGGSGAGSKGKPVHKTAPLAVDRNVNKANEGKG